MFCRNYDRVRTINSVNSRSKNVDMFNVWLGSLVLGLTRAVWYNPELNERSL